ncbi:MAG: DUF192 domain-containing protein, partial [Burkholderiales bacterium]|nr:DUF192 domain-containing protein [Burkholderiales bacterium]
SDGPWASVAGERYRVEIAQTPAEQQKGLGHRDALAPGTVMYFPYGRADYHGFWMKGMRFDIDILWIRDGRIVHIERRAAAQPGAPDEALKVYRPGAPADAVLEVNAGEAEKHGWRIGDRVEFHRPR